MKHILNNLSEEEKNSILEQHKGGMKIMNENFSKLLNSKLGDVKPLVSEQTKDGVTYSVQSLPSGKFKIFVTTPKYKTPTDASTVFGTGSMWKEYVTKDEAQKAINDVVNMGMKQRGLELKQPGIEEQNTPEDTSRFDNKVKSLETEGYKVVPKFDLADGEYDLTGAGYVCYLNKDGKNTGFAYVTTGGIRGMWNGKKVKVTNGQIEKVEYGNVYKILFKSPNQGEVQLEKRKLSEQPDFDNVWNVGRNRDESGDLNFQFDEKHVLLKDLTQKKVQQYLSRLPETVKYLVIMDCQGVDFSDVDICSYIQLRHVNLSGTPNNFDEFNNCGFEEWKPQFYSR